MNNLAFPTVQLTQAQYEQVRQSWKNWQPSLMETHSTMCGDDFTVVFYGANHQAAAQLVSLMPEMHDALELASQILRRDGITPLRGEAFNDTEVGLINAAIRAAHGVRGVAERLRQADAAHRAYVASLFRSLEPDRVLYNACKKLLDAPHHEHFSTRLNDQEMEGIEAIRVAVATVESLAAAEVKP